MGKSNTTQVYQLWASVSSALCGCVNNPQNGTAVLYCYSYSMKWSPGVKLKPFSLFCLPEELQRVCVAVFPMIKIWLQDISMPRTEIFQPICSFLAMTVANNSRWNGILGWCKSPPVCLRCETLQVVCGPINGFAGLPLQLVFRKVSLPREAWTLSVLHSFISPPQQTRVCCRASFVSRLQKLCRLALWIIVSNTHISHITHT